MAHTIIDRRLNNKGKSSENRRKFVGRVREHLKDAVRKSISDTDLKDLADGKGKVKIPTKDLKEPHFHHDRSIGEHHIVAPGNEEYVPGDQIDRPQQGKGKGNKGGKDGEGEDSFEFTLTKEEFLDIFFENCELPDLFKRTIAKVNEEEKHRSGYVSEGPPSQLNIVRSMRQAKGRRFGLRAALAKKLKEAEQKLYDMDHSVHDCSLDIERAARQKQEREDLCKQIETLKRRVKAVPFIDPMDLRFTNYTKVPVPTVQAVMFCILDVSGSMDEEKKKMSKTFFLLLYLFLVKNYERVEIVYIRHHTDAEEVDEHEFYHSKESGGTVVSRALQLTYDTIQERYPLQQWNVYVAQASDGDNYSEDNLEVEDILTKKLLPIVQYFAYIQADPHYHGSQLYKNTSWGMHSSTSDGLWPLYEKIAQSHTNLGMALSTSDKDVYPSFIKLFERKAKQ